MTSRGTEEDVPTRRGRALGVLGVAAVVAVLSVACGSARTHAGAPGSPTTTTPGLFDGAHADPSMLLTAADLPKLTGQPAFTLVGGPAGVLPGPVFGDAATLQSAIAQQHNDEVSSFCAVGQAIAAADNPVPSTLGDLGCGSTTTLPATSPRTNWPEPVWAMLGHASCDSVPVATPTAWGTVSFSTDGGNDPYGAGFAGGATVYELVTVYASAADAEKAMSLRGTALASWLGGTCPHDPTTPSDLGTQPKVSTCATAVGDQCLDMTMDSTTGPLMEGLPPQPASLQVRRGNVVVAVLAADFSGLDGLSCAVATELAGPDSGSGSNPPSTEDFSLPDCGPTTTADPVEHLTTERVVDITRTALAKLA